MRAQVRRYHGIVVAFVLLSNLPSSYLNALPPAKSQHAFDSFAVTSTPCRDNKRSPDEDPGQRLPAVGTPDYPVPLGQTVAITDGQSHEFRVGISEVFRGEAAWDRIERADPLNKRAAEGREYLMAFVVVRFVGGPPRTAQGDPFDFRIRSGDRILHDHVRINVRPAFRVEYTADMPGGGWVVREIDPEDPDPLLWISTAEDGRDGCYFAMRSP